MTKPTVTVSQFISGIACMSGCSYLCALACQANAYVATCGLALLCFMTVCKPAYRLRHVVAGNRKPGVDEDGLVHWPVMFVYPETMQTDAVEDFLEADSLQQHLDIMFAPDAPPLEWDDEHHYTRNRLELYYLSHAAKPLPLDQLTEVLFVLLVCFGKDRKCSLFCPVPHYAYPGKPFRLHGAQHTLTAAVCRSF